MIVDVLETVWSGTLEREGKAPGLSTYSGRSSIFQSANWDRLERLEPGEVNELRSTGGYQPKMKMTPEIEDRILQRLKFGWSYRQIMRDVGVLLSQCRKVANTHGVDRRSWAGGGWRGQRKAAA